MRAQRTGTLGAGFAAMVKNAFYFYLCFSVLVQRWASAKPLAVEFLLGSIFCPALPFPAKFRVADAVGTGDGRTSHWRHCGIKLG